MIKYKFDGLSKFQNILRHTNFTKYKYDKT